AGRLRKNPLTSHVATQMVRTRVLGGALRRRAVSSSSLICMNPRRRIALLAFLAILASCSPKPKGDDEATLMKGGLEALYARHDPAAAAAECRNTLEPNPPHYGATSQLAPALDAAGHADEARPLWEKMLVMA